MKIKLFSQLTLFIMLFAMISCEQENIITDDDLLKQEMVGAWTGKNNATRYTFLDDNSYIDSLTDNGILVYVINGNYLIKDGYLYLDDLTLTYIWDANNKTEYIYTYPKYKIEFSNDELVLTQTKILTPENDNNVGEIYGKWTGEMTVTAYNIEGDSYSISGNSISEYEFLKDTNLCNISSVYKIGSDEWTDVFTSVQYDFDSQYLKLEGWGESSRVSFNDNIMIWEDETRIYRKIE